MSVTHVDFIARKIISAPPKRTVEALTEDMFSQYDYTIKCIVSRFGDNPPAHAPIYKQKYTTKVFDSYGYGNVHCSIHQYDGSATGKWNRPCPFPADLRLIDLYLQTRAGQTLTLGSKSDAFMWMDMRYKITESTLKLANKYKVKLIINTMSDLVAHQQYADLISEGGHSVVMHMGFKPFESDDSMESIERLASPGAPSLQRRQLAVDKLRKLGVTVNTIQTDVRDLTEKQTKRFNKITGRSLIPKTTDDQDETMFASMRLKSQTKGAKK